MSRLSRRKLLLWDKTESRGNQQQWLIVASKKQKEESGEWREWGEG